MSRFDFDAWHALARRDPAEYFRERERVLAAFIAERPENAASLSTLQSQIDQVRALSGSPAKAARELARMLGDRLEALAGHMQQLDQEMTALHNATQQPGPEPGCG